MNTEKSQFDLLRALSEKKINNQRLLSAKLGYSLGKVNFIIKKLKEKGLIKVQNFKSSKNKLKYLYKLTPKGIKEKTRITINFIKIKQKEYDDLKKSLKQLNE